MDKMDMNSSSSIVYGIEAQISCDENPTDYEEAHTVSSISSDEYEDAHLNLIFLLSSIPSTNLLDDGSFEESLPHTLRNTNVQVPVQKEKLHFLLADYMLDMMVQTEAFLDYHELMTNLGGHIFHGEIMNRWYCLLAHCFYREMSKSAMKEIRAYKHHWVLLVNLIPGNDFEDITPSYLYDRLIQLFKGIHKDELDEVVPPRNPTKVFQQLIFQHGQRPSSAAFSTIIRWQPFSSKWNTGFFEGFGEGFGETIEESKRISYDKACRDILKQICTKFSNFVETLRRGEATHTLGFEDQICFILFQYVCPNSLEYSTQNPYLRFNLKRMSIFSQTISINAMRLTIEYLMNCDTHIPLAKMNYGAWNWIGSDPKLAQKLEQRIRNGIEKRKEKREQASLEREFLDQFQEESLFNMTGRPNSISQEHPGGLESQISNAMNQHGFEFYQQFGSFGSGGPPPDLHQFSFPPGIYQLSGPPPSRISPLEKERFGIPTKLEQLNADRMAVNSMRMQVVSEQIPYPGMEPMMYLVPYPTAGAAAGIYQQNVGLMHHDAIVGLHPDSLGTYPTDLMHMHHLQGQLLMERDRFQYPVAGGPIVGPYSSFLAQQKGYH